MLEKTGQSSHPNISSGVNSETTKLRKLDKTK